MNGYFQIVGTKEATSVRLFPPKEGGAPIDVNELTDYLHRQGLEEIDTAPLYAALRDLHEEQIVKVGKPLDYMVRESMQVRCSEDRMAVFARFYPPQEGGERMNVQEIILDLQAKGIRGRLELARMEQWVQKPEYCIDLLLVRGTPPVQGKDARIEYSFRTKLDMSPKRNPDGSVDFHNLNTICHCKKGDVLAHLIREEKGEPGYDVYGESIKPRDVKTQKLKYGNNIELSEDGTTITSMIDGHVSLVMDKVFVSDVYELENVGPSTGNVDAEGSVLVNGNVQTGYSIKAKGNVVINGVVEGAQVEAGGDIILARGMNGMGKGVLKAGGSIISKFFENSSIYSGSYVEADSILHSNVVAQTYIMVDGRKGFIVGGSVHATDKIGCKTLGSPMGTDTFVEVGIDPEQKQRYQDLRKELMSTEKNIRQIQPIILSLSQKVKAGAALTKEQVQYLKTLMETNAKLTKHLEECEEEYDRMDEQMTGVDNACVMIKEDAYAGTKIMVRDASLVLKDTRSHCRFVYERGEVKEASY